MNELIELRLDKLNLSLKYITDICSNPSAKDNLSYGAGRRILVIKENYIFINKIAYPQRSAPLNPEEGVVLNLHLNSLYFHLSGLLDNLAWAVILESSIFSPFNEHNGRDRRRVGLFKDEFLGKIQNVKNGILYKELQSKLDWHHQLTDIRDPLAHRIPLYVTPAILTEEQGEKYRQLINQFHECMVREDFNGAEKALDQQQTLGTYGGLFVNVENGDWQKYPITSQIENDLENFIEIGNAVVQFLNPQRTNKC